MCSRRQYPMRCGRLLTTMAVALLLLSRSTMILCYTLGDKCSSTLLLPSVGTRATSLLKSSSCNGGLLQQLPPRGGGDVPNKDDDDSKDKDSSSSSSSNDEPRSNLDTQAMQTMDDETENSSSLQETARSSVQSSHEAQSPPPPLDSAASPPPPRQQQRQPSKQNVRHTSDVIVHLLEHGGTALKEESLELRQFISHRAQSYVDELSEALQQDNADTNNNYKKLPHPKRVLHNVAPKIPAIRHSPDLMLRVQSYRGGTDTGVAACAIGTIARLSELYDRTTNTMQQTTQDGPTDDNYDIDCFKQDDEEEEESVGLEIVRDRRFQQLVELVLCGVDIQKRKLEAKELEGGNETMAADKAVARDMEEVLDEEEAEIDDGLSVQDACRAAWGIAILAGFHTVSFSDVATEDILTALALRSRELLLARLQLLREGDVLNSDNDNSLTLVERLDRDAEELAQDAASAMWTFACVKACTAVRSVALFETCCAILCQNPVELRERALEAKEGLDGSNFEVNDVIDKLERSEIKDDEAILNKNLTLSSRPNVKATYDSSVSDSSSKDSLLDWLSPNEVTDVLWALALHGSTVDTDSKEEIALSETAAAFREIAFDRLVEWLRRDLDIINEVQQSDTNSSTVKSKGIEKGFIELGDTEVSVGGEATEKGEMVVEVVDAAALLESSSKLEAQVVETTVDVGDYIADGEPVDVRQVQVVDAEALLACPPEEISVKTEVIDTPASVSISEAADPVEQLAASVSNADDAVPRLEQGRNEYSPSTTDMATLQSSGKLCFSPHDLCSIAWAVTDLRDPLRYPIVDIITKMFASFGSDSLKSLSMADLSNLAWAIARAAPEKKALTWSEYSETPAAVVAESAMAKLGIDGDKILDDRDVALAVRSVLREFQPPELGRLMWSIACSVSNHIDPFEHTKERDGAVSQLSMIALLTAGSNLSIFSTEDLTRIAWAFLELCDANEILSQPLVADSLGRILAVIETSLLAWERGSQVKQTLAEMKRPEDSLHFSTFFGKSRFPLPLLNQIIHEQEDDDEGPKIRKASLPLLRDLPVDPASLCKLSSGFSRLSQSHRSITGGWTFLRVAVRLLSSKNGQLMERCPLIDVIGLCHACAISEVNGRERGQVVRLFAGRVVQFMNDALDSDHNLHGKATERLARASPWEVSTLLWSLGELGARHVKTDENRQISHRKLRLVTDRPLLSDNDVQSLSPLSTMNLLHGITSMEMMSSDPAFVRKVLQACECKVQSLQLGKELVDLSQTVAKLRHSVDRLEQQVSEDVPTNSSSIEHHSVESDGRGNTTDTQTNETVPVEHNATILRNEIVKSTNHLLSAVATLATEMIGSLSAVEMRKLLLVYTVLPFRADGLVNAIERETIRRMQVLGFKGPAESVQDLARRAFESSLRTSGGLSSPTEGPSPVESIKNGIRAIFGVHEDTEEDSKVDVARLAALAENAQITTTLTRETLGRMEQIRQGTGDDTESLLKGVEQGAALELGRCKDLIDCYRRIDFSTGTQEPRYDTARRRDISKRILSRLFP